MNSFDRPYLERRDNLYTFNSFKALTRFFMEWIPTEEISKEVEKVDADFVPRKDATDEELRLQKIKKVEVRLLRRLKNSPG